MILTKQIEIKKINDLTSDYIDETLKEQKLDVISWAIVATTNDKLILNVNIIQ